MRGGMSAEVISLRPRTSEPSLAPMLALTAPGMNSVNAVILERMQSEIPLIPALAGHLISGGGKRLRPMLTIAGAALCDYHGERHHKLAAAVEFIHTATLLHDDVVDGSDLRRGKETANIAYGNPATVLVGDFLFSRAFELMVEDGSLRVLKILSHASAVIAEGEVDQLTAQRHIETSEDRYLSIIGAKTAALFSAACTFLPSWPNVVRPKNARWKTMAATWELPSSWSTMPSITIRKASKWAKARATISATAR